MTNNVVDTSEDLSYDDFPTAAGKLICGPEWRLGDKLTGLKQIYGRLGPWRYSNEYMRQMIRGDKTPSKEGIEAFARAMGKKPEWFLAYRVLQVGEAFKTFPDLDKRFYKAIMIAYALAVRERETQDGQ